MWLRCSALIVCAQAFVQDAKELQKRIAARQATAVQPTPERPTTRPSTLRAGAFARVLAVARSLESDQDLPSSGAASPARSPTLSQSSSDRGGMTRAASTPQTLTRTLSAPTESVVSGAARLFALLAF